jgi:hypothetical protein
MNKFVRVLIALVVAVTPLSAVAPAQAVEEPCQYYGTIFAGSPYARYFGTVCGQANINAIWPSVEAHMNANSAAAAQWFAAQAAEQQAQLAAEEAARVAAATAADAANCEEAATVYSGTPWARTFPAICTAVGIQGRSEEIRIYSENVAFLQAEAAAAAAANQPPPTNSIDCNLELWRNAAQCINPTFGIPPINPDAFNCALPQNAVLPTCTNQGPVTFPDGTLNCANPVNVVLAYCINKFNAGPNGGLDCTQSELRTLPACLNGTVGGVQNTATFNATTQPMVNADGSMNCAQADNAITTTCMDLLRLSANGTLDCTRAELKNLPACINGSAPGGVNAPTPPSNLPTSTPNVSAPTSTAPVTTGGVVAQPNSPSNLPSTPNKVASEKITKNKEDLFPDADGEEEDPAADLSVTYSKSLARYIVKVDSNLAGESLILRGVKKGAKSLKFTLTTDEDGVAGIRTKTKLAGFTLTLYLGSTKLDSVKVS